VRRALLLFSILAIALAVLLDGSVPTRAPRQVSAVQAPGVAGWIPAPSWNQPRGNCHARRLIPAGSMAPGRKDREGPGPGDRKELDLWPGSRPLASAAGVTASRARPALLPERYPGPLSRICVLRI